MHEAGIEPDWVIGTSIGAINAALIAGNEPQRRLERLRAFWESVEWHEPLGFAASLPWWVANPYSNLQTIAFGVPGFFAPNPRAWLGVCAQLGVEAASFYDTSALRGTLARLVDFERINRSATRLTVGAVNARSGAMRYFDSRDLPLGARARDGFGRAAAGVSGDPHRRRAVLGRRRLLEHADRGGARRQPAQDFDGLLRAPLEPERQRAAVDLGRARPAEGNPVLEPCGQPREPPEADPPPAARDQPAGTALAAAQPRADEVQELLSWGCHTTVHIVRLLAPRLEGEDHNKDIDFTPGGIHKRWDAGYTDAKDAIAKAPWHCEIDPLDGVLLHEHESMHARDLMFLSSCRAKRDIPQAR